MSGRASWAERIVGWVAPLVPEPDRDRWRAEWLAELRGEAERPGTSSMGLLRASLGALPDALTLRRMARGRRSGGARKVRTGPGERVGSAVRQLSLALRRLSRAPAFAVMAATTLALGIAASTAIFAVVDSVLLSPLDYPDADRLVLLRHPIPGLGEGTEWGLSVAGYFHFGEQLEGLEELGAAQVRSLTVGGSDRPERVESAEVDASLLRVFGARPAVGRLFLDEETRPGGPRVAILGHGLWSRSFGEDPGIVGSTIQVEGSAFEVVGVMERGMHLPDHPVDLWTPGHLDPDAPAVNSHYLDVYGRLRPGVEPEQVQVRMAELVRRLPDAFPNAYGGSFIDDYGFGAAVRSVRDEVVGGIAQRLWLVFGGVALVLLIACANVANLFLVRADARGREVAVRSALGAGRRGIVQCFMTESLALAAVGALAGTVGAVVAVRLLAAVAPEGLPRTGDIAVGGGALAFAAGVSLAAGVVFGFFPLLRHRARDLSGALRAGGRGFAGSGAAGRTRQLLVVGQVAMAVVLLAASGLMLRSFLALRSVDAGFDPRGVQAVDVSLPSSTYGDAMQVAVLYEEMLTRLEASPGVAAAGAATRLPLSGPLGCWTVFSEDPVALTDPDANCPPVVFVTPGYFAAMGIPVVEGRAYEHRDNREQRGPAILSQALADRFWPGERALDRGVRIWTGEPPYHRVVGIVGDVRAHGLDRSPPPIAYFPMMALPGEFQWGPPRLMTLVVRTTLEDPSVLVPRIREILDDLAPDAALSSARTVETVVARSMVRTSFTMVLLGIASGIALLLGAVGIYGVISYTVGQRTAEVGLRMALGARALQVGRMVLGQSMTLVGMGLAVGLLLTLGLQGALRGLLFEVGPFDPATVAAVSLVLVAVAVVASYAPAARAARIDPASALAAE